MTITTSNFGTFEQQAVNLYTLATDSMRVSVMNVGATITSVQVKNKAGEFTEVCLGFDNVNAYVQNRQYYLGCVCGRYANRIANGQFTIDEKTYQLATNLAPHHLHGGVDGFNFKYWQASINEDTKALTFKYTSPDGEENFPGKLDIAVTYRIENNVLKMAFDAVTDTATPINLTNHAYFNLSGERNIQNHELQIMSTQLMKANSESIPSGEFVNVANTLFDFTQPVLLSKNYAHNDFYDNSWLLSAPYGQMQKAATVRSAVTGIELICHTSFPSVHFYDGHFLDNPFYSKQGFCLEAQFLPDSPNQPNFPNAILRPGEKWQYATQYEFNLLA